MIDEQKIRKALKSVLDPELKKSLLELGMVRDICVVKGQVMWGKLHYLVVDLPPGTGDPSITIAQSIPSATVLMVTTPQEVALADVRRAVDLLKNSRCRLSASLKTCPISSMATPENKLRFLARVEVKN